MLAVQGDLFGTGICCAHCNQDPGRNKRNGYIWDGFYDLDTKQHVCEKCRFNHYRIKWKAGKKMYSERPVAVKPN